MSVLDDVPVALLETKGDIPGVSCRISKRMPARGIRFRYSRCDCATPETENARGPKSREGHSDLGCQFAILQFLLKAVDHLFQPGTNFRRKFLCVRNGDCL